MSNATSAASTVMGGAPSGVPIHLGAIAPTPPAIAGAPAIAGNQVSADQDIFALAQQINKLLDGCSNKNKVKVLTMVGSLHGLRVISVDRPIGQPAAAPVKEAKASKQKKSGSGGAKATPKSGYKQTPAWIQASTERSAIVDRLRQIEPADAEAIATATAALRAKEQELKALKPLPGN